MSVGLVMELILAIAVGLGLSRATMSYWSYLLWYGWGFTACASFFAGVSLVFGPMSWLGAIRRRDRAAWGWGRKVWSAVAIYYLTTNAIEASRMLIQTYRNFHLPDWLQQCFHHLFQTNTNEFFAPVATGIASFGITRAIARDRSEPPADAREWALRVAAILLVATYFGFKVVNVSVRF